MKNAFSTIKFNMNEIEAATGIPADVACSRLINKGIKTTGGVTFDQIAEYVVDIKGRVKGKNCDPEKVELLKSLLKMIKKPTGETLKITEEE